MARAALASSVQHSTFPIQHSTFRLSLPPHPPPPTPRPLHARQLLLLLLLDAAQQRVHGGLARLPILRLRALAGGLGGRLLLRIRALRILLAARLRLLHGLAAGEGDLQVALRLPVVRAEAEGLDVVANRVVIRLRRE